jgi:hypothetical protein
MAQTQLLDISGGLQTATTWQMKQPNEIYDAENMRFDQEIGGAERRLGYTLVKSFSDTYPLGCFPAEFSTGDYIFHAYNNSRTNPTATVLSYYDPFTGTSTVVKNDYPKNCKLSFVMNSDELYVAGITTDTGSRQTLLNVTKEFVVSTSRNLYGAPKAALIGENSGALYAMNVELNGVVYPDRAYISSSQRGAITYINSAITASPTVKLDSARYIKVGMVLDIYGAGTGYRKYSNVTVTAVNNSTDTITLSTAITALKTDELWLAGRFGDGSSNLLWNTDYRDPQTADFLFIASGKTASTAISGWGSSNNRMMIFTTSSLWQYDNANFIPIFKDIGCISNDTICNNGTFIIWLDATGKVRARDSNSGQDQIISRAIKNQYLENLSATNLSQASAVMYDGNYKLSVGTITIGGVPTISRFIYNFDMNIWWREAHTRRQVFSFVSNFNGTSLCYFLDELGNLWLDESGNLDGSDTIPWFVQYGRRNLGVSQIKTLSGLYVFASNLSHASSAAFMVKLPGVDSSWNTLGQLTGPISAIEIPDTSPIEGRDFDFKISGNSKGDPAKIEGIEVWSHVQQSNFS